MKNLIIILAIISCQPLYAQRATAAKDTDNTKLKQVVDDKAKQALAMLSEAKKNTEEKQKRKPVYKKSTSDHTIAYNEPPCSPCVPAPVQPVPDTEPTPIQTVTQPTFIIIHDTVRVQVKKKSIFKRIFSSPKQ